MQTVKTADMGECGEWGVLRHGDWPISGRSGVERHSRSCVIQAFKRKVNWLKVMAFSGFQNGGISIPPARYPRTKPSVAMPGLRSRPICIHVRVGRSFYTSSTSVVFTILSPPPAPPSPSRPPPPPPRRNRFFFSALYVNYLSTFFR